MSLGRKLAAEAVGTMLLLTAVVGSGIMGDRLSGGNAALALLANSVATGAAEFSGQRVFRIPQCAFAQLLRKSQIIS